MKCFKVWRCLKVRRVLWIEVLEKCDGWEALNWVIGLGGIEVEKAGVTRLR